MKTGVQLQKTDAPIYIFLFITHIVVIACQEVLYEKLPKMEKKKDTSLEMLLSHIQ